MDKAERQEKEKKKTVPPASMPSTILLLTARSTVLSPSLAASVGDLCSKTDEEKARGAAGLVRDCSICSSSGGVAVDEAGRAVFVRNDMAIPPVARGEEGERRRGGLEL